MSDPSSAVPPTIAAPVQDPDRLTGIDTARGLALVGIFMVNAAFFGEAFGNAMTPAPNPKDVGVANQALFYLTKIFFEGKFYGLFSLLFGVGFTLQWMRLETARFTTIYARRLGLLLLMGMCHAWLLWYGDILFLYAFAGLALLLCRKFRVHHLVIVAVVGITFVALVSGGMAMLQHFGGPGTGAKAPNLEGPPFNALWRGFEERTIQEPQSAAWIHLEERAYREGGWLQALGFRAMTWLMMIIMSVLTFFWSIVAMFFLGAALVKSGVLAIGNERVLKRLTLIGLLVGAPLSIAGGLLPTWNNSTGVLVGATFLMWFGAPLLSVGYLGSAILVTRAGVATRVVRMISNAGRMALTNYLSQTVIATFVFYHWGLAQFGLWERWERAVLVALVWACQLVVSTLWLSRFRMGPMEWLWRTVTYWKVQPIAR